MPEASPIFVLSMFTLLTTVALAWWDFRKVKPALERRNGTTLARHYSDTA